VAPTWDAGWALIGVRKEKEIIKDSSKQLVTLDDPTSKLSTWEKKVTKLKSGRRLTGGIGES